VTGFCMFGLMYYAPLMLQGGFGLSPDQAGLLVTPLAVFITVGSIVNGRVVTQLAQPGRMLYAGLTFFCVATVALTQTGAGTPTALVVAAMMCAGTGLGLLLPNLTLFTQSAAPRTRLGVATAMLQSMRMIGGMLGVAVIGTLVSHRYTRDVHDMLLTEGGVQWQPWLADPQILLDQARAADFGAAFAGGRQGAAALLDGARQALVDAIHGSQWLIAACLVIAFWLVRRAPHTSLHRAAGDGEAKQR